MYETPLFLPAGDQALVVELGGAIDAAVNRRVHDLAQRVEAGDVAGVVDLIPAYRSLLVQYDATATSLAALQATLLKLCSEPGGQAQERPRVVHIPTLYGGEHGPDLPFVAEQCGLTTDEVVRVHSETEYLVYMMGFTPGFPYLGGLDERLATPRLPTPRQEIPAGSVGIAENQTGVYPFASPGGWRLIGRTPVTMFDPVGEPPSLLAAGDYVRFTPLRGENDYAEIRGRVESGEFQVTVTAKQ
jgi:KipI family sensor histidine kinase inhibitor